MYKGGGLSLRKYRRVRAVGHGVSVGQRADSVLIKRRLTPRTVNRRVLLVARFRINLDFRPEARNAFRASRARNEPSHSFATAETINSLGIF